MPSMPAGFDFLVLENRPTNGSPAKTSVLNCQQAENRY